MQKRDVTITLILSFVAFLVLIALQIKWTMDAYTLTEKQFTHRVTLALHEVMDKISRSTELVRGCTNTECSMYQSHMSNIEQAVNHQYLDSLIRQTFIMYNLDNEYRYKLFSADKRQCPSLGIFSNRIYLRPHDDCTTWKAEEFELGVFFPQKKTTIMKSMMGGIMISTLLVLFVVFAIYYFVGTFFKQKRLSRIKNDFINNMTHEFKTPLSTISLAAEVLQKSDPLVSRQRILKYSTIIQEENHRLRTQVDYILKMAMLQKKEVDLHLVTLDLHEMIREVITNMCLDSHEKKIQVFYELEATCHHAAVDKLHFSNIIINLVNNAIKYSDEKVSILVRTSNQNGNILIAVHDNGLGIAKEHLKHIFEKFYRVSNGDVHDVKGFGLGLFYVKEMVQAHKGEIQVESEPGKGTIFTINLHCVHQNES